MDDHQGGESELPARRPGVHLGYDLEEQEQVMEAVQGSAPLNP